MDDLLRKAIAKQGFGVIIAGYQCADCGYIAENKEEKEAIGRPSQRCPNCGMAGSGAGVAPPKYLLVANWIGEYAASENRRDHVSAVVLFCALVESIRESLKTARLTAINGVVPDDVSALHFKEVFGRSFTDFLSDAPEKSLRRFPHEFAQLKGLRNRFLHGSGSHVIGRRDAMKSVELAPVAVAAYRWLNNGFCLRGSSLVEEQP